MTARYANSDEIKRWNTLILSNPDGGNIFSSFEYAEQKRMTGYKPVFIMVDDLAVTVLQKNTPPLGRLWYLPKGPGVKSADELIKTVNEIEELARKAGVFVIKVESEIDLAEAGSLEKESYIKSSPIIPNPSTITLDISADEDALLLSLPQKGRHAIRRAERDGVKVELAEATDANCRLMYKLLQETAEGKFGVRNFAYFKEFWQSFEKAGLGQLFFAKHGDRVVAGAFAMVFGEKSTYKDGASIREKSAYGASHLLQWEVIKWAKSRGAVLHDFCGSPPSDQIENTEHPHYGIGRFKLSFSKNVVDYIGCYDKIINPNKYKLWKKGLERVYRSLYYRIKKDYYY